MLTNYPSQQPSVPQSQAQTQYNTGQFFPQPQGNVFLLNSSLEVATVPMSNGISAALCLSEGLLYLKTIQGGNPMLMVYNISPYVNENQTKEVVNKETSIEQLLQNYGKQIADLTEEVKALKKSVGGRLNEQLI